MFGEKHWNRGAIKCLDTLMEGMVDCQRLRDLKFEEICWNWSCCRFTWQSRRVSEIASRTEQGAVWGARFSMLDCHLVERVWYIYDWDTGWLVLMWWEASTGFSCMSFTR